MKIHDIIPPSPSDVADWSDVAALQQRMAQTVTALAAMADDVGMAKHVLEYDGARQKQALARGMAPALAGGDSAAKAEAAARADACYAKEIDTLARQHLAAEQTIAAHDAARLVWETCRSLLAMTRESVKRI